MMIACWETSGVALYSVIQDLEARFKFRRRADAELYGPQ